MNPIMLERPPERTAHQNGAPGPETPSTNGKMDANVRLRRDLLGRRFWRKRVRRLIRGLILSLSDAAVVAGAAVLLQGTEGASLLFVLAAPILILAQAVRGTYGPGDARRNYEGATYGVAFALAALLFIHFAGPVTLFGTAGFFGFAAVLLFGVLLVRLLADAGMNLLYRMGIGRKRVLVIGDPGQTGRIRQWFGQSCPDEYHLVGYLAEDAEADPTALGTVDQLQELIEEHDVSRVLFSSSFETERFRGLVERCFFLGAEVAILPGTLTDLPYRVAASDVFGWPMLELQVPRLHLVQLVVKRALDVVLSVIGLIVLLPAFAVIAVAIKLSSPGPVLFKQQRHGLGGRRFAMLKFRTMRKDAEEVLRADRDLYRKFLDNDCKLPEGEDPRIFAVGRLLRRTSLDELPQLLNVLRGEMSIVGPRPVVGPELENYGQWSPYLLSVKPGLTGYWQVNGRSSVTYPERAHLDIHYVRSWSLLLDLKIILATLPKIVAGGGAH